jgi:hypothetical protein
MNPSPCPADDLLVALAHGALAGEEAAGVRGHLDECETCLALVAEAARDAPGAAPVYPARYQILEEGGRGGQARVLRAYDLLAAREVAIKELLPDDIPGDTGRRSRRKLPARFVREAQITARLTHPGIVPVFDIGERSDGEPYYTMPYVRGRTLAEALPSTSSTSAIRSPSPTTRASSTATSSPRTSSWASSARRSSSTGASPSCATTRAGTAQAPGRHAPGPIAPSTARSSARPPT